MSGLRSWALGTAILWVASIRAASGGRRLWEWPIWFLAVAMVMNGIVHPLLSLLAGGYFPGVITAPLVGVAGLLLLRFLSQLTGNPAGRS